MYNNMYCNKSVVAIFTIVDAFVVKTPIVEMRHRGILLRGKNMNTDSY